MAPAYELVIVQTKETGERDKIGVEDYLNRISGRVDKIAMPEVVHDGIVAVIAKIVGYNRRPLTCLSSKDRALESKLDILGEDVFIGWHPSPCGGSQNALPK